MVRLIPSPIIFACLILILSACEVTDQFQEDPFNVTKVFTSASGDRIYAYGYNRPDEPNSNANSPYDTVLAIYQTPTSPGNPKLLEVLELDAHVIVAQTTDYLIGTYGGAPGVKANQSWESNLSVSIYPRDSINGSLSALQTFNLMDPSGAPLVKYRFSEAKRISDDAIFFSVTEDKTGVTTDWDAAPKHYSYVLYAPTDIANSRLLDLPTALSTQACQSVAASTSTLVCFSQIYEFSPPKDVDPSSSGTVYGSYASYDISGGVENAVLLHSEIGGKANKTAEINAITWTEDAAFFPADSSLIHMGGKLTSFSLSAGVLTLENINTTLDDVQAIDVVGTNQSLVASGQLALIEQSNTVGYGYVTLDSRATVTRASDNVTATLYAYDSVKIPGMELYAVAGNSTGLILVDISSGSIKVAGGHFRTWSKNSSGSVTTDYFKEEGNYASEL